jgi:hypothetical protein
LHGVQVMGPARAPRCPDAPRGAAGPGPGSAGRRRVSGPGTSADASR